MQDLQDHVGFDDGEEGGEDEDDDDDDCDGVDEQTRQFGSWD